MSAGVALYVRLVSCLALAINFVDRRKDLFEKARLQARVYDSLLRPVGRRGDFSIRFLGKLFRTPWLPMFRTQLRAIFVDDALKCSEKQTSIEFAVDAGANLGLATIGLLLRYKPRDIISLEADPEIFDQYTVPNLRPYVNSSTQIICLNKALWTSAGEARFLSTGLDDGQILTDIFPTEVHDASSRTKISVETVSLADLVNFWGDPRKIDFLKMDIEGSELFVLGSMNGEHFASFICFEVELTGAKVDLFLSALASLRSTGYHLALSGAASGSWAKTDSESAIMSFLWVRAFL